MSKSRIRSKVPQAQNIEAGPRKRLVLNKVKSLLLHTAIRICHSVTLASHELINSSCYFAVQFHPSGRSNPYLRRTASCRTLLRSHRGHTTARASVTSTRLLDFRKRIVVGRSDEACAVRLVNYTFREYACHLAEGLWRISTARAPSASRRTLRAVLINNLCLQFSQSAGAPSFSYQPVVHSITAASLALVQCERCPLSTIGHR